MIPSGYRAPNHWAVAGFLLPFVAAGLSAILILVFAEGARSTVFPKLFLAIIPPILLAGVACAIRSIPCIRDRGDKDYAYAGLTINLCFLAICLIALPFLLSAFH